MSAVDLARLVKPLEWCLPSEPRCSLLMRAFGSHGLVYEVYADGAWFSAYGPSRSRIGGSLASMSEAKQACHANYAARVIAALDADLLAELVGALRDAHIALADHFNTDHLRKANDDIDDFSRKLSRDGELCRRVILILAKLQVAA